MKSAGVKPSDLFDDDDIGMFQTFCEENGIDPTKGYALVGIASKSGKHSKKKGKKAHPIPPGQTKNLLKIE